MIPFQALIHIAVPSVSGQAVLTMPLFVPMADVLGLSRQVPVLAYQTGARPDGARDAHQRRADGGPARRRRAVSALDALRHRRGILLLTLVGILSLDRTDR